MNLGFTGSREFVADARHGAQHLALDEVLRKLHIDRFHHGDCIGGDEAAHNLMRIRHPGAEIVVHPPLNATYRAHCLGDVNLRAKDYLSRNHDIVNATDALVALPNGPERQRSGTWATVRYALALGRPVVIVSPGGDISRPGRGLPFA